jgi:hypothetical protein
VVEQERLPTYPRTEQPSKVADLTGTPTLTSTYRYTPTHPSTATPSVTSYPEPEGCLRPPDNYDIVVINGHSLNARTLAMLQYAASLYGGVIDVADSAITQGSYTDEEPLSFGTHAGGGAVDISVVSSERWEILYDEIPPLLKALRIAGFAAWLREPSELMNGSSIHIHAIAIGDQDLTEAAEAQLTGEYGYFRGYNGLPPEYGGPALDRYGGPIICRWMLEMGYQDLRLSIPKK